jgi:subtilisin family serine protease
MNNKSMLALAVCAAFSAPQFATANTTTEPLAATDSIIVVFKQGVGKTERQDVMKKYGVSLRFADKDGFDARSRQLLDGRIAELKIPKGVSRDGLIKQLSRHSAIEIAEPNYLLHAIESTNVVIPNDPRFTELWGMNNTGASGGRADADIDAVEAWDLTKGSREVIVGVIDTGTDYNHPDLAANIWTNPNEIAANGIDDDNNGVIDDIHGFSAVNNNGNPMDGQGHGTHVAGTIGASGDNATGVVGVNWNVTMIPCQFLGADGSGTTAGAIACINYFTNLKQNHGVNVRLTSNSWGGGGFSQALSDAIQAGNDAGILFIAAAGNDADDSDVTPHYPSAYNLPGIISVASTDRSDNMSSFSTYGAVSVDLGAPGSAILSTTPNNSYASFSGTSMATPHVAGAAALVWSLNPDLSLAEMKTLLMDSGDSLAALAGKTVSGKRLNVKSALDAADPEPGFSLGLTPAQQTVTAGAVATYTLSVNDIADWQGVVNLTATATPTLPGLNLSALQATPGQNIVVTAPTTAQTPWGTYQLAINGIDSSGALTKSAAATLKVLPTGLQDLPFENTAPVAIPDNNATGLTSVINVPNEGTVFGVTVAVNISHTWIGDLIVKLVSPTGTEYVLHNKEGGSADNIVKSWTLDNFNGEALNGDWKLKVSDTVSIDTGTLNSWSLNIKALTEAQPDPIAPVADFSFTADDRLVSFTNGTTDSDSATLTYVWNFGDGQSSTEQNPQHEYSADGSYTVTLTATDDTGLSAVKTATVEVVDIDIVLELLRAQRARTGSSIVDLRFSGALQNVDVYRNGNKIASTSNAGSFRDRFNSQATSVTYKICHQGTNECSNNLVVQF